MDNLPKEFGIAGLYELVPARHFTASQGWQILRRFKGNHDACIAAGTGYANLGYEVSVEPIEGTPKSILTVSESGSDLVVESVWTLLANAEDATLWLHPRVSVWTKAMSIDGLAQFRKDVNDILNGETPINIAGLPADLQTFIHLLAEGLDTFYLTRWVLRNSRVVAANTSLRPNQANTLRVFTTAELQADESIPPSIIFQLPLGDWLKQCGTTEQLSDGRFQFGQEWWWRESGGWDERLLYQHAT